MATNQPNNPWLEEKVYADEADVYLGRHTMLGDVWREAYIAARLSGVSVEDAMAAGRSASEERGAIYEMTVDLQNKLTTAGFYTGPADGSMSAATRVALDAFNEVAASTGQTLDEVAARRGADHTPGDDGVEEAVIPVEDILIEDAPEDSPAAGSPGITIPEDILGLDADAAADASAIAALEADERSQTWDEVYNDTYYEQGLTEAEAKQAADVAAGGTYTPSAPVVSGTPVAGSGASQPAAVSVWREAYNEGIAAGLSDSEAVEEADAAAGQDKGMQGQAPVTSVLALQEKLAAAGFNPGPIDGIMGPKTQAAVDAYEASTGETLTNVPTYTPSVTTTGGGGGGGGGGGEVTDGATPSGDVFTDEETAALAAAHGYGARWLLHEELGPILQQAASEGWYDSATGLARLEAEIKETDWWGEHDRAERDFQLLESSDPATAADHLDNQVVRLTRAAGRIGLTVDTDRMRELARDSYVEGWSDYEMNQYVVMEADWATGQAGGQVGDFYSVIDQIAGDYMIGHLLDDETKDAWAEALFLGDETELGLRNDISLIAQSAFPSLEGRIAQGYTARQILSPLRMEAARLLEMDATSIDFMTDPRFQSIIHQVTDDGSERIMTVSEVGQYVRGLDDYKITDGAKNEARELADQIGKKFGRTS